MSGRSNSVPSYFVTSLILVLVAGTLFIGLLSGQFALARLSLLVLAMNVGAKAWSRMSLARISSAVSVDRQRLFPGDTLTLQIAVHNAKLLPIGLQVRVPAPSALRVGSDREPLRHDAGLSSYQQVSFEWQVTAVQRGVHRIGPAELEAGDPLGFYTQRRTIGHCEVLVYPQLIPLWPLPIPGRDFYGRKRGDGPVEDPTCMQGMRDYQAGHAARFIHWKASARHNRLLERISEPTAHKSVLLVVRVEQFADAARQDAFERCLEVVASLAVQLERQRYSVGLVTNGRLNGEGGSPVTKASRAAGHLPGILETLARLEPVAACDLLELLGSRTVWSPTSTVICFDYERAPGLISVLDFVERRRLVALTVICASDASSIATSTREYQLDTLRSAVAPIALNTPDPAQAPGRESLVSQ